MPDIFRKIIEIDPEILLRSDLAIMKETDRSALVESLLKKYEAETLLHFNWDIQGMFRKLSHHDLVGQLKPYICDKDKGEIVRQIAIHIAESCRLQSFQDDLADIALDSTQSLQIRIIAARAVCIIGDSKTKAKLRPLALGEAGEDTDDELKGIGLRGVWPDDITAEELFMLLTPPKKTNWFGSYWYFIEYELAKNLKPSDLSTALVWVKSRKKGVCPGNLFNVLIDDIMLNAWENADVPVIMNNFVEVLLSRLMDERGFLLGYKKDSEFRNALSKDDKKRRLLL